MTNQNKIPKELVKEYDLPPCSFNSQSFSSPSSFLAFTFHVPVKIETFADSVN